MSRLAHRVDRVSVESTVCELSSSVSPVAEHLIAQHSAIKMLHSRVRIILEYVKAVDAGEIIYESELFQEIPDAAFKRDAQGISGMSRKGWGCLLHLAIKYSTFVKQQKGLGSPPLTSKALYMLVDLTIIIDIYLT